MHRLKHILGKVFNRFVIMVILILIQFAWVGIWIVRLSRYSTYTNIAFTAGAILMALFVIYRDDNPAYKVGWIMLICLLPILGTAMYAFFGNKRPSAGLKRRLDPVYLEHERDMRQSADLGDISSMRLAKTINYIAREGPYPAWRETGTRYFPMGDEVFPAMLEDMKKAEHFIFMEYFIIAEGSMWDEVHEVLLKKVRQGVDVRIIYDDVGSIQVLPWNFASKLESEGIHCISFNPLRPVASLVYNNRDHRKILVVDGYIGYSGGFNIADEYVNRRVRFGRWKDNGIRLEGEAVWNLTVMFLNMWNAFRRTEDDYEAYRPHLHGGDVFESDGIVQPFSDTPLDDENLGENVYLEVIAQAEKYLYIYTPYLILDNELRTALGLAAKRGVDVRIVTPGIPDKRIVFRLTRSYYLPLIRSGVRIYEYTPGFLHSKSFIADDKIGVIGSINLDYRSLYLHFECGTFLVGCSALRELKEDCEETFTECRRIRAEDMRTNFFSLLFDGVLRVLSPLL